jgi:predicted Fe-S protein YdhL (DUF1289 family)
VNLTRWCVACALALLASADAAAQGCAGQIRPPALESGARGDHRDRDIYGWQLMTQQERHAFLAQLDAARSPEERAALRRRNHQAMDARARERGVVLRAAPKAGLGTDPQRGAALDSAATCIETAR